MRRFVVPIAGLCILLGLYLLFLRQTPAQPPTQAAAAIAAPDREPGRGSARAEPISRLEGSVLGASGERIAGATIRALREDDSIAGSTTSDAAGQWRITGLGAGDYLLHASSGAAAATPIGPVPLADGETLGGLDLVLERAASLAGTVRDGATGATIEGARLRMAGVETSTDRAGRFRLDGMPIGAALLHASAPGYEPRLQQLELAARAMGGIEISLRRGASVQGRVLDGATPVAGARVQLRRYQIDAAAAAPPPAATTGPDGSFHLDGPAGLVELEAVAKDGRTGRSVPLELPPGGSAAGVEIQLEEAAELFGQVLAPDGGAAGLAEVQTASLDGRVIASTAADAAGRFAFGSLPAGIVRVIARQGGASGVSAPITVGGAPVEIQLRLGAGELIGRVEDARGEGVVGAQVIAWAQGAPRSTAAVVGSGPDGSFRFEGLPDGPLQVEAAQGERRAEARGLFADGPPLRLVVGAGQLVGVVLSGGSPATDFTVAAAPAEAGRAGGTVRRLLSADGSFRLSLPPGRYEVRAGIEGGGFATGLAEVPPQGDSNELLLEIAAGGVVEGFVREAETGEPIPGVRISTSRSRTFAFGQAGEVPGAPQAMSGPDGSFRLGGLPAGRRLPVFAWKPGYRPTRPAVIEVAEGRVERIEIVLARGDEGESAFGGVGITLGNSGGALLAADVIEGGPGWEAGVRRGDRILAIDGAAVDAGNLMAVVGRVRGPVGTPVILDLSRGTTYFRAVPLRAELRF